MAVIDLFYCCCFLAYLTSVQQTANALRVSCESARCPQVHATAAMVCGRNGITYTDVCRAICAGTTEAYRGACTGTRTRTCSCDKNYKPVCGSNRRTYFNDCEARCSGVQTVHEGSCTTAVGRRSCTCITVHAPVCGVNGRDYNNQCQAHCDGTTVAYNGRCRRTCSCTISDNRQVCGRDGRDYANICQAQCAGTTVSYYGQCRRMCRCPYDNRPVCGRDGRNYPSDCQARCAGTTTAYYGQCSITGTRTGRGHFPWCTCPANQNPIIHVCGTDRKMYSSACQANCAGVRVTHLSYCSQ